MLMKAVTEDGPGVGFRWILFTDDAHGLYEQFGFTAPDARAMVRLAGRPVGDSSHDICDLP